MSRADPPFIPPIPSQPLPYSIPVGARRPGIITAIGVMSIVIACLSAFSSFLSGTYSAVFYFMSQVQSRMATVATTSSSYSMSATAGTGPTAPATAPTLPGGDASVAVNALDSMLKLDPAQIRELDRLMRRHGREVVGGADDTPVTAASVRAAVISLKRDTGKAKFTTVQGTVETFPDHATFSAADGSTTLSTSARRNQEQVTQTSAGGSVNSTFTSAGVVPSTMLTSAQVNLAVSATQAMAALAPAQVNSLRAELSKPSQTLVMAGSVSPVTGVLTQPNGNLAITFDSGNVLILGVQGKVISSGPRPMPNFGVSGGLAAMDVVECIASIGLAIYLLIVGILVLRGSFASPRMLRIYAGIKIPLALIAGVGLMMLGYQLASAMVSSPGLAMGTPAAASTKLGFAIAGAAAILFGLAFPVGVLIALRSKTVSQYYNAVVSDS